VPVDGGWAVIPLHGIGGRQDLPVPFSVVLVAAVATLVISFLVLMWRWPTARYTGAGGTGLPRLTAVLDAPVLRWVVRGVGLGLAGWALLALLAGPDQLINPVFGFVYVWVWVGLVPISLLLGPVWATLNPFRTVHLLLARLARVPHDFGGAGRLPTAVGVWPGVVLLSSFVWLELVAPNRTTIAVIMMWVAAYAVVQIIGGLLFGTRWYAAADPFEVYALLMAKLSPWGRGHDRLIVARSPLANLATLRPVPGTVGFVAVLLGSTAFDGFSNSTGWIRWIQTGDKPGVLVATTALLGMITIVAVSYQGAVFLSGRLTGVPAAGQGGTFIHSLVPIVLGYVIAHYLTLTVFEGQRTLILFSDPLNAGWNVFGTAHWQVGMGFFAYTTAIAVAQAGAVLLGHVGGVVAAHDRALAVAPASRAVVGQIPMLVVMIGYTLGGLWLLFSP
jgi:hypothetical protein